MKEFSNQLIDTSQLPSIGEVSFLALDPKYKKVILFNATLVAILTIALSSVFYWTEFKLEKEEGFRYVAGFFLGIGIFIAGFSWIMAVLGFSKKAYAFREKDVIYRSGIIHRKEIVIPYNRVQHVALHEGMISRMYRLATLEFFTAGGVSGDLKIPGIPKEQAERIKQFIIDKVNVVSTGQAEDSKEENHDIQQESKDISNLDGNL